MVEPADILGKVERYYSGTLAEHGPTPAGADWNSAESQELRFEKLLEVCEPDRPFSINDYGCGYGALVGYMRSRGYDFSYAGFDVSGPMLEAARKQFGGPEVEFVADPARLPKADYTVASGIFNVRLDVDDESWKRYVLETIERLAELSEAGFSFNMLTGYSDAEHKRAELYYADPAFFFDHCKTKISPRVALLHDYPLYEFTILVRKESGRGST